MITCCGRANLVDPSRQRTNSSRARLGPPATASYGVIVCVRTIPLTRSRMALVDDEDYDWLSPFEWHYHCTGLSSQKGYAARFVNTTIIWMHREINRTPDGLQTDHINGNTLDNRKENLRSVSASVNSQNRHYRNNLGLRGVIRDGKKYRARIKVGKVLVSLGTYDASLPAALAFDKKAQELYGEHARINFYCPEDMACCLECGHRLEIVRPGKYQCPDCE